MRAFCLSIVIFLVQVAQAAEEPVILYEHDPTLLTTSIQVVILSGSADDPSRQTGLRNFLAELLLRGTKRYTRSEFQDAVERLGGSLSVGVSHDVTAFAGKVIKENTNAFLSLLEEALFRPAFSVGEFQSLKREITADIAHQKNNNMRLAGLALRRTVFADTPLERPVTGTLSTVKKIELPDVVNAYNKEYHRGNFLFAVASPIDEAKLRKRIVDLWKKFGKGERHKRVSVPLKIPASLQLVLVHKPKTSTGSLIFGQAGIVAQESLRYVLGSANYAFGGEPLVSRLFRTVRSELGWTYAIGATYHSFGQLSDQQGLYTVSSTPSIEYTAKAILKILSMWKDYLQVGLTEDELALAKESLVNSYPFEFDSAQKRLSLKVHSHLYGVPILSPEDYGKEIGGVTNQRIIEALGKKQTARGWLIAIVADKKVVADQLTKEQAGVPEKERLTISKTLTPDALIQ